jgi:epoxyqueuosine reductase
MDPMLTVTDCEGVIPMRDSNQSLTDELKAFAEGRGADLFGVADLTAVHHYMTSQGLTAAHTFPRAVSIGMSLNDGIVDGHSPQERRHESLYWHHVYNVVTPALDFLAYDVSRRLTARGFQAFPVPGSTPYDFDRLMGLFPHKLAAHLAGLGWIGKSCLLVTKAFGPRVRFVSILTDAPLPAGTPLDKPCGKCHACVDACPVQAFTGVEFHPEEGRDVRFDVRKCSEYRRDHSCGLCVSSCPQGKRPRKAGKSIS